MSGKAEARSQKPEVKMKQIENKLAIARCVLRDVALQCVDEGFGITMRQRLRNAAADYRRLVHESEKGMHIQ